MRSLKEFLIKFFSVKLNIIIASSIAGIVAVSTVAIIIVNNVKNKNCLIQFNVNGGSVINDISLKCGDKVERPLNPVKNGFNFVDWLLEDSIYDFNLPVNKDIILNAKWENDGTQEIVKVTFDSDGGSQVEEIEVAKGNSISEPITPTKKGYSFMGWYYNDELFDFSFFINEDINLKAKWEKGEGKDIENSRTAPKDSEVNSVEVEVKNKNDYSDEEIKATINNLKGKWYSDDDLDNYIYIEGADTYIFEKKAFELYENNFNMLPGFKNSGNSNYLYYPVSSEELKNFLESFKITYVSSSKVVVANKYNFSRNKKAVDYSQFEKYLGTWYLVSGAGEDEINITREGDIDYSYYRIGNYAAEVIDNTAIHNKTTVFDKYTKWSGNNLKIGNGIYSRTKPPKIVKLNNIVMFVDNNNCKAGESVNGWIRFNPDDASDKSGVWTSSNQSVATVDQNGKISCLKSGSTNVTFVSSDGNYESTNTIFVEDTYLDKIILDKTDINLKVGEETYVNYSLEPSNTSNKEFDITVNQSNVAEAYKQSNDSIKIKAINPGTVYFTFDQFNQRKELGKIKVTVESVPMTFISLDKTDITLNKGDSTTIKYIIYPENATNKTIKTSSSNPKVATVSKKGTITGVAKGTAVITFESEDGTVKSQCNVTVNTKPLKGNASLLQGQTCLNKLCNNYVIMRIYADEGNAPYKYTYRLFDKDGKLVFSKDNILQNEQTYSFKSKNTFRLEYLITDADNATVSGSESKEFDLMDIPE